VRSLELVLLVPNDERGEVAESALKTWLGVLERNCETKWAIMPSLEETLFELATD
jgi:hypothetical protein